MARTPAGGGDFWLQTGQCGRPGRGLASRECYLAPISTQPPRGGGALTEETLHTKHTLRTLAALAAAGLALTACGTTDDSSSTTANDSGGTDCTQGQKIAFLGATTGDYGALGLNMVGGIKLALDEYNTEHSDCAGHQDRQGHLDHRPRRSGLLR
jgi:hypothetical protein